MSTGRNWENPPPTTNTVANLVKVVIPRTLANVATRLVDSLKISSTSEKSRRGRRLVIKRRNIYRQQLADLANLYFRMSGIPVRFWSKTEDWKRWEVKCFKMLNGDRFRTFSSGTNTISVDKVPGEAFGNT